MSNREAAPRDARIFRKTPSAVGERQMLAVQTKRTERIRFSLCASSHERSCDNATSITFPVTTAVNRVIYDVGAHRGEDAAFYLQKGFAVVAVEANPLLAADL